MQRAKKNKKKKLQQKGPVNNQIDIQSILYEEEDTMTTLMIRNIPINNFTQADMVALIDKEFRGQYNYFYQPKDLKTQ